MIVYKFKSFAHDPTVSVKQAIYLIKNERFWCSNVDDLNDPFEYNFRTIINGNLDEKKALYAILNTPKTKFDQFQQIKKETMRDLSRPIIEDLINKSRTEIGVCSFSKQYSNELWKKYGGSGNGICVALKIKNPHPHIFHPVKYYRIRKIQLIDLLNNNKSNLLKIYRGILASKTLEWKSEKEIRFISNKPDVNVKFENSKIVKIIIGKNVSEKTKNEIRKATKHMKSKIKWMPNDSNKN